MQLQFTGKALRIEGKTLFLQSFGKYYTTLNLHMSVLQVTDAQFQEEVTAHQKVVVKYYADWCGSCKLFAPKYKRLSADERFAGITFLDVNAEKNPVARRTAGVTNLPFFAVFKDGELVQTVATSKEDVVVELISKLN
jgi:thiol-disulfide isomerase/thioredoxin